MSISIPHSDHHRFTSVVHAFAQGDGLPFVSVLTERDIVDAAQAHGVHFGAGPNDVYTPAVTLWTFLAQVLAKPKSCVAAVSRMLVLRVAMGLTPCSAETGAYCKARAKLPEAFLRDLTYRVGHALEDQAPDSWRWRHRRVLLVDGFTSTMPDTPENQKAYPQPSAQKPGLGFPIVRMVVLLAFATAAIVGAADGPYKGKQTGEEALFRRLFDQLRGGDVVVADRLYCSYFLIALLRQHGVDVAFRLHAKRKYDFRRGQRLGRSDHIVVWQRPVCPKWMDAPTYATLPETLTVRELRLTVDDPGFRSRNIVVATTMLDANACAKSEITDLYRQRWHAELDLRSIQQTMQMERLTCKKPAMVRKEIWAHLLAYNLARKTAAQAAITRNLQPRQISFAGVTQTLAAFRWLLLACESHQRISIFHTLFRAIATHEVGDRPNRVEPRATKRRLGNHYPNLRIPRHQARAKLTNQAA